MNMFTKSALLAAAFVLPAMAASANEQHMEKKADYWFNQMDANKDGTVTKSEHQAFATKMFTDADSNNDGNLSKPELTAAKKSEKEKMKDSIGDKETM